MSSEHDAATGPMLPVVDDARATPPDDRDEQSGVALCLSGGGYRAMLFHLGCLIRLNEIGRLRHLSRVSSVSGGSITAGVLGMAWNELEWDADDVAVNLEAAVVKPVVAMAGKSIDVRAVLTGALLPSRTVSQQVSRAYDRHLFRGRTLQDLPDHGEGPRFVINATNVQTGSLWRFSKPYMRDYQVGEVRNPTVELATAVAASSAFPPVLSPARLELDPAQFSPASGEPHHAPPYTSEVFLSDGGVYDNLGLETAWKRYDTILVSDAGLAMTADPDPGTDWATHAKRVLDMIDNQVRSLRKRQLVGGFQAGLRKGTYWSIRSVVDDYGPTASSLPCAPARAGELAQVPTRLADLPDDLQERLINWGYAICDVAMRRWVDPDLPAATRFPYARGI